MAPEPKGSLRDSNSSCLRIHQATWRIELSAAFLPDRRYVESERLVNGRTQSHDTREDPACVLCGSAFPEPDKPLNLKHTDADWKAIKEHNRRLGGSRLNVLWKVAHKKDR